MRSILKRLSRRHGTAVAYLALFASLGGTAYAAATITGENIVDGTVTSADVADETLTGLDTKDGSLGGKELAANAVTSDKVADANLGGWDIKDGTVTGADIDIGVRTESASTAFSGDAKSVVASCPVGWTVLGGGGRVADYHGGDVAHEKYYELNSSHPSGQGWRVTASDESETDYPSSFRVTAYAICARV